MSAGGVVARCLGVIAGVFIAGILGDHFAPDGGYAVAVPVVFAGGILGAALGAVIAKDAA